MIKQIEEKSTFNHPKNKHGQYKCTKKYPMPNNASDDDDGSQWVHKHAREINADYDAMGGAGDSWAIMECPLCKIKWRKMLG